jgi:hypothetical protein
MTDKTSVEGIAIWLKQVFGSSSWMAGRVAQELNDDILEVIQTQYPTYHANIRLGILFALLCIRKGQQQGLLENINTVSHFLGRFHDWGLCERNSESQGRVSLRQFRLGLCSFCVSLIDS